VKILVTGGAGFIGSNFIRYWLKKYPRDEIINLDKLTYAGNLESLKGLPKKPRYSFYQGDINDRKLVDRLVSKVSVIVHFAAESHVDRSLDNPDVFLETNILGTHVLLQAALKHGIKRFHYISTDEVFGSLSLHSKSKFKETTPYDPRSPYSASKAAADHLVRSFYHSFGLPITITNCSNNYGSYCYPEKFIPRMITNVLEGKKIPIYGDGKYVRDWLYVEDHCRAIDLVLKKGKVGETYCVGGLSKDFNNLRLAKMILKIMGKDNSWLEYISDRPGHDRRYAVDWGKIKKELGWRPRLDLEEGLAKTIFWYQDNEWWWKPLKKEAETFYKRSLKSKKLYKKTERRKNGKKT